MDEAAREEFKAALAIRHTPGLGARTWKRLLDRYGSAIEAALNVASWTREGLAMDRQAQAFKARGWREPAAVELEAARTLRLPVVLWTDPRYPARLKEIHDPPLFLYGQGRLDLLATPGVAVVGARQCSRHGLEAVRRIAGELSRAGLTVISGLALGIDREAHLAGLESVGSSIAVLGTGLDIAYPEANEDVREALAERGLIVTELPPSTMPAGQNFPIRNRIISGLSLGVVVVEASDKSGSLITARLALEQGREVFALSGPASLPSYTGCHTLLDQGATLVGSAEDILRELAPLLRDEIRPTRAAGKPRPEPSVGGGLPRTRPVAPAGRERAGRPEARSEIPAKAGTGIRPEPGIEARPEVRQEAHGDEQGHASSVGTSTRTSTRTSKGISSGSATGSATGTSALTPAQASTTGQVQRNRTRGGTDALPGSGPEPGPEDHGEGIGGGRTRAPSSRTAGRAVKRTARSGEREPLPDLPAGPNLLDRPDRPDREDLPDMASMSLDEQAVVALLAGSKLHFDEVCRRLGWEASKVGRVLVGLEVLGAIRKWPGMYYTLV